MFQFVKRFACVLATGLLLTGAPALSVTTAPIYAVGATATGILFTFLDVKTNSIQGLLVDAIKATGKASGFDINIEQTRFSSLIPFR